MKTNLQQLLKTFLFLPLFILVLFTSCQNEESDVTDTNTEESFDVSSALATSILRTTTFDGSLDNIIDSANCISVNLPVTVIVNGVTITIESIDDYDFIEDIFDEFDNDDDEIEIQFPITIILNDYTQVVIENYDQLFAFVEDCSGENEDDDDIECIDFQYPITITIFDGNFDFVETMELNDDEELYEFIDELEGGVLASINFPVNMVLADGSIIKVTNNEELQVAIEAAEDACDEDDDNDWDDDDEDDCSEEFVELALKECIWNIVAYNGDNNFANYDLDFDPNYGFIVSENGNVLHDGSWSVSLDGDDLFVDFETSWQDLNGNWEFVDCDDDRFELEQHTTSGNEIEIVIEQNCENNNNPFECYSNTEMELCDDDTIDGFAEFDLNYVYPNCVEDNVEVSFYGTVADAEAQINPLESPYTNISNPQTIYARVQLAGTTIFEVFDVELYVEDCSETGCTEEQVDQYLMECHWVAVSYNGDDQLAGFDIYFNENMDLVVEGNGATFNGTWSTAGNPANGVFLTIEQLPNDLQDLIGQWQIVECTETQIILHDDNSVEIVLERDCTENPSGCSEEQIDNFLLECTWNVVNFNGSEDLIIFDFDFNNDGTVTIIGDSQTITAMWSTSVTDDGVWVEFSQVNAGNIQTITGNWLVVECEENRLEMHVDNDILVMERTCP